MDRVLPKGAILVPEHAERVFKGQIFDVYQWPEKMYDGKTATFEMLKRPDTVKVVGLKENKIVVIEDTQPSSGKKITFPGGQVSQADSSWLEAAKREMLEETGLRFKEWRLIDVSQPVYKIEWFAAWYVAYDVDESVQAKPDGGEKIKVNEYSFKECFSQIFSDLNRETQFIPAVVKKTRSISEIKSIAEFSV